MVIARVHRYWARGSRPSPGILAATSSAVAPHLRCQGRSSGATRNRGRSPMTAMT
jgi:hypothetical protein